MGRNSIDVGVIRPKGKINATFKSRKEGLMKKAKDLGILCGCEVALIVIPPEGYWMDTDVIDVSVNGSVDEIFQKYAMFRQQHPGRQQLIHIPGPTNLVSQQPGLPNVERNDYELPSTVDSNIPQTIPGGMEQTYYAPPLEYGVQPVFMSPNAHVGSNEQVSMPQQVYGMPQENQMLQSGNYHIPQQYINCVPMPQGSDIPQQQGHEAIYRSMPNQHGSNQLHQQNAGNTLFPGMASAPPSGYAPFIQPPQSDWPDSADTNIDETQFLP